MTDKSEGPYRREQWEANNEYVITGPDWNKFPGVFNRIEADRIVPILNIGYAAGLKAGLEWAAVIAGRQTGWVAGTIQEDIREELEKI